MGLLVVSAIPAAFSLYAALRTGDLMGIRRKMFEGLGFPIPPLTEFVLNGPNLWWVIATPAVLVFAWIASRREVTRAQQSRMKLAVAAVVVFGAAVYAFVLYALMRPIHEMSKAV